MGKLRNRPEWAGLRRRIAGMMNVDRGRSADRQLGTRLASARQAVGMTVAEAAAWMGMAVADLETAENGRRRSGSAERLRLAYLYMRDARSFEASDFAADCAPAAMLRSNAHGAGVHGLANALRRCVRKDRHMAETDTIFATRRAEPQGYALLPPQDAEQARRQGVETARLERMRLRLGKSPIWDMQGLLEGEGVRATVEDLPSDVSGLMITTGSGAPFVAVRRDAGSGVGELFARAYAHVLFDRVPGQGTVSRPSTHDDMSEQRADAFAMEFLVPTEALEGLLSTLHAVDAPRDRRAASTAGDPTARTDNASARDTASAVAERFGVSRSMAEARLRCADLARAG